MVLSNHLYLYTGVLVMAFNSVVILLPYLVGI